jgi:hypothetical protein
MTKLFEGKKIEPYGSIAGYETPAPPYLVVDLFVIDL